MNTFGRKYRVTIFGESHGERIGVVVDGVPAGIAFAEEDMLADLARRRSGARGTTPRKEDDLPRIASGTFQGVTTGAPLTILFENNNTRSDDYERLSAHPRPGHADWVAGQKFGGYNDPRGGGHFSGRITLGLVAAGVLAKKILDGVAIKAETKEIGGCADPVRFPEVIENVMAAGDSVGGIIECRATGIPVGWGEPFFDSAESLLAHAVFSIPGVKGIEFGSGFEAARLRGSQNNDPITDAKGVTATNNAGGINGGITNGNELVFRISVKPTPSISAPQQTFNLASGTVETLRIGGRHDVCVALRVPVVLEAATAVVLADFALSGDV
ncbi:MAG: chorismate synthase [Rikenellaceae bacterium]|jgi:chorismate synthase|nr:chorismate synthase [Rikenellaceae bacterium]